MSKTRYLLFEIDNLSFCFCCYLLLLLYVFVELRRWINNEGKKITDPYESYFISVKE